MDENKTSNQAWRNPWFLGWMGLLLFVFIVNMSMVYLSIKRNSARLLTADFYEKGKAYSDNRLKLEATKLDWMGQVKKPTEIKLNQPNLFRYTLVNQQKQVANPDKVIFYAYRPSDGNFDFATPMQEITKGQYQLAVKFPLKGIWDIIISAQKGDKEYNKAFNVIVYQKNE